LSFRYERLCTSYLFANADALALFFGFQHDSVKCQVEHVVMLLANYAR
jgi:hypothetical protein